METIKEKLCHLRTDYALRGDTKIGRLELAQILEYALRFFLAFSLARAEIFGGYTPFAVGIVAASGASLVGMVTLLGALLGYALGGDFIWSLKYIAMSTLVYASNFVFSDLRAYRKLWFRPGIAVVMAALTGFVYVQDAAFAFTDTVFYITEIALVGASTYFFQIAFGALGVKGGVEQNAQKRAVSVLILLSVCLIALSGVNLWGGMALGRLIAVLFLMSAAYKSGAGSGSAVGAAFGIAMDASSGGAPFFSMAYAFSGLFAGLFRQQGKLLFATSFVLANAVAVLWTWDLQIQLAAIYEVFFVSMVFMLLPSNVLAKFALDFSEQLHDPTPTRAQAHTKEKVRRLALAYGVLHENMKTPTAITKSNDNDIATIFDRAAESCCRKCEQAAACWHVDYETTLNVMNDASVPMLARGELCYHDFPGYFRETCKDLERYVDTVNLELKALKMRQQFANRLEETRAQIHEQYADMGKLLSGLHAQIDAEMQPDPIRQRKLARYLQSRNMEGDCLVFRDKNGRLHAEIHSEGLGALLRDPDAQEKLSIALGVRLRKRECAVQDRNTLMLIQEEPLAADVGIASMRRRGQLVSGDRGSYFKTDDGYLYVILCDGMGTGTEAYKESAEVSQVLEEFLQAGLDPDLVMKLVNAAFGAKHGNITALASIDLLRLNLFTGEAKFYKCGAAPTYVKAGTSVQVVAGESLACGLSNQTKPDRERLELTPGSHIVIVSDGIAGELADDWLQEEIANYKGADVKHFAKALVQSASARRGADDDMTVLTVYLDERARMKK